MKFELGQKIKIESIEDNGRKRVRKDKVGEIVGVTSRVIVLQYKNYKESLSIADFQKYKIFIRADKKWIQLKIK